MIVLQAGGTRASGKPAGQALEKIENSARQALAETRRVLGVLRDPDEVTGFAPQPGIGDLDALAASVRAAGLPVNLVIDGDFAAPPATVDVSAYRIVQEALTNVLKHAGPARADVTIGCTRKPSRSRSPTTEPGEPVPRRLAAGTGWPGCASGPRSSAVNWRAGPRPGGGFAVRVRLPLGDAPGAGGGLS